MPPANKRNITILCHCGLKASVKKPRRNTWFFVVLILHCRCYSAPLPQIVFPGHNSVRRDILLGDRKLIWRDFSYFWEWLRNKLQTLYVLLKTSVKSSRKYFVRFSWAKPLQCRLACRKLKENANYICRARKMLFFALLLSLQIPQLSMLYSHLLFSTVFI